MAKLGAQEWRAKAGTGPLFLKELLGRMRCHIRFHVAASPVTRGCKTLPFPTEQNDKIMGLQRLQRLLR